MPLMLHRRTLLRISTAGVVAPLLPMRRARAAADAAAPVAALNRALTEIMKSGKTAPFPVRYQTLAPAVEESFDLPAILRMTIGARWEDMPRAMQTALSAEFLRFTVASYVANFDDAAGQRLEIMPDRRQVGGDVVVATRILFPKDPPVRIDYVMRENEGQWRVVDVLLDGSISRVAVQRSDFRHILEHGGPSALIASLHKKVEALSGGTLT